LVRSALSASSRAPAVFVSDQDGIVLPPQAHVEGDLERSFTKRGTGHESSLVLCTRGGVAPPEQFVSHPSQGRLFQNVAIGRSPLRARRPGTTPPPVVPYARGGVTYRRVR